MHLSSSIKNAATSMARFHIRKWQNIFIPVTITGELEGKVVKAELDK